MLVKDDNNAAQERNQQIQEGSNVLHAEVGCLENAGRISAKSCQAATLRCTLSPFDMFGGAVFCAKFLGL